MSVTFSKITKKDNMFNSFLNNEDKIDDQIQAKLNVNGKQFYALGDTKDEALKNLKTEVYEYFNAQKHIAQSEINKSLGQYFYD